MKLTKEEAIKRHRLMWNWIAEETLRRKKCVDTIDAFKHFGWRDGYQIYHCWCCAYDRHHGNDCSRCPIKWPSKTNILQCIDYYPGLQGKGINNIWRRAVDNNDWRKAAYYAFYISMLPENPDA